MQGKEIQQQERYRLEEASTEDQRSFVGFFELLLKVDKRVNPHLYQQLKVQQND